MTARIWRKFFREPFWLALVGALALGAFLGFRFAHEQTSETAHDIFGLLWRGTSPETRAVLAGIFGFQATVLTIVLSLNGMIIKAAGYQYSPRLIPLYVQNAPIRRAIPLFVLLTAYILAAERELGLVEDEIERPRFVVSGAIAILLVGLLFLAIDVIRTIRFIRVERVLDLVRDATYAAAKRVRARVERLPLDSAATIALPRDASALVARESGYLVDIDMQRLTRLAQRGGVRTRISHAIGDYVDEGEVIGWMACDEGRPLAASAARKLADTVVINAVRDLDYDPALGIRIIVDVANRAMGSSSNDPYTARQALNQLRSVLRHLGRLPFGDWNVVDSDGSVRVSVMATHLRDLLALAVEGPLRYGAADPDVLEGVFEIVLAVGRVAQNTDDREATRILLDRVLEELAGHGGVDRSRLLRLRAEADPVRASLGQAPAPHA